MYVTRNEHLDSARLHLAPSGVLAPLVQHLAVELDADLVDWIVVSMPRQYRGRER